MEQETYMFKINDFVMYNKNGICKITDIQNKNFNGMGERKYYVLHSVYDELSVIYIPVDSSDLTNNMRSVLLKQEIASIIQTSENITNKWIGDSKIRALTFERILNAGNRADILWLIKTLSLYKMELERQKKKLYLNDARILAAAEKLISDEFAFVLNIKKSEVIPYIIEWIKNNERREQE